MKATHRTLLVAAIAAAVIGFTTGWFARVWTEPTVEDKAVRATDSIRDRFRGRSR